ncbi:S-layer homology domain-containing protein [Halalkalibacter nanhaiisediminis]|uniref:S-layer family protein n=1 Tax=Halalkalibacter nanhaiisediminis TaxID=688079 RepID=A0A562QB57_9BACI|nr:S-layer homology domain-containing protein [Halalkalibacter nanhaiisediminis]TWI53987.1 S-layer family protein [Halalkalibacter nanhaiisediminis]
MCNIFASLFKKISIGISLSIITIFIMSPPAGAAPPDFNGGINNEYTYEEYIFLSGEPVKFSGQVTVTERERNNQITTNYRFNLTNAAQEKLTRNVSYITNLAERTDKGQTTTTTSVNSYNEKTTIEGTTYTLDDYQLSQGMIIDNRPASDYYSGNIVGRKIYKVNNQSDITVHFSGRNVGYENFWGGTETQIIDYQILSDRGEAFITSKVSDSKSKTLKYEPHDPSLSSFTGGHARISQQDMIGEYTYNIPYGNGTGIIHLNQEMVPIIERLIVPKFRDLTGHWARDNIERLYSLGVFDETTQFFSPNTVMNRYQFTVGVMKAADIRVLVEPRNQRAPRQAMFSDLDPRDPDYLYIESAVKKGVVNGINSSQFGRKNGLTRAQAVTILIRALGLEDRAPSPGYRTNYVDNAQIPYWAKDSVYVATEIGLIYGDNQNRFNPNQPVTRAEASAMIIRYLNFLENDLKQNYRDDMLFF